MKKLKKISELIGSDNDPGKVYSTSECGQKLTNSVWGPLANLVWDSINLSPRNWVGNAQSEMYILFKRGVRNNVLDLAKQTQII